ncbi:scarecrow-like protein 18 [Sesamum indicum]|uniref:Scarecrow-like protein 18 n=1 Tax=Sesamum indicum TaxID=4182 RepID=A0A6I9UK32_SESIN|nr:scarecrow-like protein 18 [Sesamum indicum]
MLSNISQTEQFHSCGGLDEYDLENLEKKSGFCEGEKWGELDMGMDSFGCGVEFFGDCSAQIDQQQQQFADFGSTCADEFLKTVRVDSQKSELIEPEKKGAHLFPSASFEILNKYRSRCRRLNGEYMNIPRYDAERKVSCGMSVVTIIQLAAEKFIQSNESSLLSHPYLSSMLCRSEEDSQGVQLVQNVLACADKVGEKQYERARNLLLECDRMSSPGGTPVQRLVFYFTEALYEKIDRETGRITPKGLGKKIEDPLQALKTPDMTLITFHKKLPLSQITKFAGIQAVVDDVAEARKVHFIDLEIRKGIQCTILMQALAARSENPIEHLKITAVAIKSKASIEETGRQLTSFAQSLDLKFSFNVVMVEDIFGLKENLFDLDEDEAIAVYAAYTLTNMIGQPDQLEHLIRIIKSMNPCMMVVTEVEANCNSPIFVERFVEALFFYGACFESMAECLKNDEKHRCIAERTCFSSAIRNIVAAEGDDRKIRHVGISVWRAFFTHFGFEETELSMSAVYQANLVVKNFTSGSSYTFDIDGKSLIIGWKGAPVSSLSAWKFQCPM